MLPVVLYLLLTKVKKTKTLFVKKKIVSDLLALTAVQE